MGIAIVIRITMMLITTISSTKVNPRRERESLPVCIGPPIRILVHGFGVYIEDVLAAPIVGGRIVLVAADSPLGSMGERIHRDATQELHDFAIRALRQFHTLHQRGQA